MLKQFGCFARIPSNKICI